MTERLTQHAGPWARIACDVLSTAFPYAAAHVSHGASDCTVTPARLHPAFHGALDWHSSAHMQWSLVTLLNRAPDALAAHDPSLPGRIVRLLGQRLGGPGLPVEAAYLRDHPGFERPYGWAWAAMLCDELGRCELPEASAWQPSASPLAAAIGDLVHGWLERQTHPVRGGEHTNSAFALSLLHRAYTGLGREDVIERVEKAVHDWYIDDTDYPTRFEPSGHDFLSPALSEAECVVRLLPVPQRAAWIADFLPGLGAGDHGHLLEAPRVLDPSDGKLAHFYGLALSRAWQLRTLAPHLPDDAGRVVLAAADAQTEATLPVVTGGHFMATHWLVSFALLGELERPQP